MFSTQIDHASYYVALFATAPVLRASRSRLREYSAALRRLLKSEFILLHDR